MAKRASIRVEPSARVADAPRQLTSMAFPAPVHQRLDDLVERASVMRSSRAEVVAMLIANADLTQDELEQALLRYRKMTAGELSGSDEATVVRLHGPGRRKPAS